MSATNEQSPPPYLGQEAQGFETTALYIPHELQSGLGLYLPENQVVEIRVLNGTTPEDRRPTTYCGFFNNHNSVIERLATLSAYGGVYVTLNPVNPALLSRASNRLKRTDRGDCASDRDIPHRSRLLIDLDAVRPSGISSTDEEHEAALVKGREIITYLESRGWPAPAFVDSGNGAHLVYVIDLPSDDGGLVQRCLEVLASRFNDDHVHVDQSVFNPARIVKLPGTWAFKGDNTEERPWRLAVILHSPEILEAVPTELLEQLAAEAPSTETQPRRSTSTPDRNSHFDLEQFIQQNAFDVTDPHPWDGDGRMQEFNQSPMCDHHDRSAYMGRRAAAAPLLRGAFTTRAAGNGESCDNDMSLPQLEMLIRNRPKILIFTSPIRATPSG